MENKLKAYDKGCFKRKYLFHLRPLMENGILASLRDYLDQKTCDILDKNIVGVDFDIQDGEYLFTVVVYPITSDVKELDFYIDASDRTITDVDRWMLLHSIARDIVLALTKLERKMYRRHKKEYEKLVSCRRLVELGLLTREKLAEHGIFV